MRNIVATLAAAALVGCGTQNTVSASDAKQEVHDHAAASDWDEPDEDFFLTMVGQLQPDWDAPGESVLNRAYCHAVGQGRDVVGHWIDATQSAGWTMAQARDVLSAGVAALCPWHMDTLGDMTTN